MKALFEETRSVALDNLFRSGEERKALDLAPHNIEPVSAVEPHPGLRIPLCAGLLVTRV